MFEAIKKFFHLDDKKTKIRDDHDSINVNEVNKTISHNEQNPGEKILDDGSKSQTNQENLFQNTKQKVIETISKLVNDKLTNENIAKKFVLEELDAASRGDSYAQNFVDTSGIPVSEYQGAMHIDDPSVDESYLESIQLYFRSMSYQLVNDKKLLTEVNIGVVDNIMRYWKFGKYEDKKDAKDEMRDKIRDLIKQVNELRKNERLYMALQYSAAGLPISPKDMFLVAKMNELTNQLTEITGYSLHDLFDNGKLDEIMHGK